MSAFGEWSNQNHDKWRRDVSWVWATFHYFQGMECDMYSFYRIPKLLFTSEYLKSLLWSKGAVRTDVRPDVTVHQEPVVWRRGQAYIFFSVEEIMEMLNCGRNKAVNCLKELDQEKGLDWLRRGGSDSEKQMLLREKFQPDRISRWASNLWFRRNTGKCSREKENTETEIEEYAKKSRKSP